MEDDKSVFETYAHEVYSGRYKDPTQHERSREIHEGKGFTWPKLDLSFQKVFNVAASILLAALAFVAVLFCVQVYRTDAPAPVSAVVDTALEQLQKIEVVRENFPFFAQPALPGFIPGYDPVEKAPAPKAPQAWELRQSAALAKIEADLEVKLAQIASQEKLILEVITNFYKSGNSGALCLTWRDKEECFKGIRDFEARSRIQLH